MWGATVDALQPAGDAVDQRLDRRQFAFEPAPQCPGLGADLDEGAVLAQVAFEALRRGAAEALAVGEHEVGQRHRPPRVVQQVEQARRRQPRIGGGDLAVALVELDLDVGLAAQHVQQHAARHVVAGAAEFVGQRVDGDRQPVRRHQLRQPAQQIARAARRQSEQHAAVQVQVVREQERKQPQAQRVVRAGRGDRRQQRALRGRVHRHHAVAGREFAVELLPQLRQHRTALFGDAGAHAVGAVVDLGQRDAGTLRQFGQLLDRAGEPGELGEPGPFVVVERSEQLRAQRRPVAAVDLAEAAQAVVQRSRDRLLQRLEQAGERAVGGERVRRQLQGVADRQHAVGRTVADRGGGQRQPRQRQRQQRGRQQRRGRGRIGSERVHGYRGWMLRNRRGCWRRRSASCSTGSGTMRASW